MHGVRGVHYLLRAVDKNAIQDEVRPEERPLTLYVLKQLQLRRLVIQSIWILHMKQSEHQVLRSSPKITSR